MRLPLQGSLGNTPQYPISYHALTKRVEMFTSSAAIVTAQDVRYTAQSLQTTNYFLHGL